jgi:hypothetical protein
VFRSRKRIAALAEAIGIPEKQFAGVGSGKILIKNDKGSGSGKKK